MYIPHQVQYDPFTKSNNFLANCPSFLYSGIGSNQIFCLTLRREQPEQMLIVADRQGRIKHASASLAKILDTTPEGLQVRHVMHVMLTECGG